MTIFGAQGVPDAIEEELSCAFLKISPIHLKNTSRDKETRL
jgi:hypothetical protein